MSILSLPASRGKIITLLLVWGIGSFAYAQETGSPAAVNRGYVAYSDIPETKKGTVIFEAASGPCEKGSLSRPRKDVLPRPRKDSLSDLSKASRVHRSQGLEFQREGDLDRAMGSYKRAIALDPNYAVAYNDLGVIYEAKGLLDSAEESYLTAINRDPYYLSAYSNLALLYEQKHQLDNAAYYWKRRVELGTLGDPWVEKAKEHLRNLGSGGQAAVDVPPVVDAAPAVYAAPVVDASYSDTDTSSSEEKILGMVEEALEEAESLE